MDIILLTLTYISLQALDAAGLVKQITITKKTASTMEIQDAVRAAFGSHPLLSQMEVFGWHALHLVVALPP